MADKKRAKKVDRRQTRVIRDEGKENYERYVEKFTDKRIFLRLVRGARVKPCGKECEEYGFLIAREFSNHSSFQNFPDLMNNEEFLLNIAQTSRNPATCSIYFYDYINPYLKRNKEFRLKFLKAIYLNKNIYTLEDMQTVVEYLDMQKENETILADLEFRKLFEKRFEDLDYREYLDYHCSGEDEKVLREFKVKANELKVLLDNMRKGLTEILATFTVGEKVEDEPRDYGEYLCRQSMLYGNNIIF